MEINTALILCAGYGKRLNPLTLNKPKPLIEINKITLLQNTLNLINSLGCKLNKPKLIHLCEPKSVLPKKFTDTNNNKLIK